LSQAVLDPTVQEAQTFVKMATILRCGVSRVYHFIYSTEQVLEI